jgi:hypothetical protein
MMTGDHNLAVILDGNIARRLGLTDEQLFTIVSRQIQEIDGVKSVYAYELTHSEHVRDALEGRREMPPTPEFVGEQGPEPYTPTPTHPVQTDTEF